MADNFDNYSMKVQARVDLPSNKDIDAQIRKLEKSISKLKVSGQFDDTALKNLTNQLNSLKATVTTANFSPTALADLTNQVNNALQNINIGNINVGNVGNQAQQVGQQIGQQINQGVSQSLSGNIGVLDTFRRSLANIGMGSEEIDAVANRIENLGVKIEALNQSTSHTVGRRGNRDILSVDISGTDRLGQAIKLTEQYNMATGDLIRSMDSVSTAQQKAGSSTNTFAKQQSQAVTNLTNQINQLNRAANDQNKARPITDSTHLDRLSTAYNEIISAIQRMGNASSDTFVTEQNNVKTLISNYKSLVSEFRNAENVSTKMKGTDFASGLAIARNDLEKFKADAKDFPQIIQTINNLDTAISSVGDVSSLNKFNDDLRVARSELAKIKSETSATNRNEKVGINVSGLQSQIADLQRISPEIDKFEANINGAKVTVQSLLTDLANVNTQSDFSVINSKWKAFTDSAKSAGVAITEVVTKSDSLTDKANEIQLLFDNGHGDNDYKNRIDEITQKFKKYGLSVDEANEKTEKLRNILSSFKTVDGSFLPNDQLIIQADKLEQEFDAVKISVDKAKLSYNKFMQPVTKEKASSLVIRINDFLYKNTNITKKARQELETYVAKINNGVNLSEWNLFDKRLKEIKIEMGQMGRLGKSFSQTLKDGMQSFIEWSTASGAVMEVVQAVKVAIDNVRELDDQLLELSKVSDLTSNGLTKITKEAYNISDTVGKTGTQVLEAITTFKRAGFELADSSALAETALKMVNVAEGIDDASESAQYLISIMKGYGDTSSEFATKILDSVNEVSNTQSVDFDNLVDGGQRLSAVANQAGVSFDQMLGVLTGGYEVLGNMEKTASGLITIFTRLQSIQMADEEEVESVAKLQETFSNATKGRVNIVDQTTGQLRGAYDILNDLNNVWNELDKNTQEGLAFAAGGTRQKSVFLSIMSNWESVEKSVLSSIDSINSAEEENAKYLESLSGKIIIFESAVEKLSNTLLNSNIIKFFVDLGTTGVNAIDGLVSGIEDLNTLFGLLGNDNIGGTLGAISGLVMNLTGNGERAKF